MNTIHISGTFLAHSLISLKSANGYFGLLSLYFLHHVSHFAKIASGYEVHISPVNDVSLHPSAVHQKNDDLFSF